MVAARTCPGSVLHAAPGVLLDTLSVQCHTHVYAHVTEKTITHLGLTKAVYCEDCLRDED